ncbi:MAG: HEAT repeat domain-containing protein [Planctomycetes bacterium]|nr:HEAT repeat domain-containing protein [Planctomycetota bacterium]
MTAAEDDVPGWQTWWRFHRDAYLELKGILVARDPTTEGAGPSASRSSTVIDAKLRPALQRALQSAGDAELVRAELIALARTEASWGRGDGLSLSDAASFFLSQPKIRAVGEAAVVALGVRKDAASIALLNDLVLDTPVGRAAVGSTVVDFRTRAFAAYALGLIGEANGELTTRKRIARTLIDALAADSNAPYDLQLALLVALGLVPLENCADTPPEGSSEFGHLCRGTELSFLLDFVQDPSRHPRLRAQAVVPLARLAQTATLENLDAIREALLVPLAPGSRSPSEVRQSAIIGLGLLGDADRDGLDREVRDALLRELARGERLERGLAAISLARVAGRPGRGEDSAHGQAEIEAALFKELSAGRGSARAWAAIAFGVLERALVPQGRHVRIDAAKPLRSWLTSGRSSDEIGAACIALGLLRDPDAVEPLGTRVSRGDAQIRGHAALALGLIGDATAREPLSAALAGASGEPELYRSIATALRLLGVRTVLDEIASAPRVENGPQAKVEAAMLLGSIGDARSIDPLVTWLSDSEEAPEVRRAAAWALGELADRSPRPWTSSISVDLHFGLMASTLASWARDGSGLLDMR